MIRDFNNDILNEGWGWILQLIGGLLVIYGIMTLFQEYTKFRNLLSNSGPPSTYPPLTLFIMDKETKKLIWILLIMGLVIYFLSPVPLYLLIDYILVIIMVIIVILLILTYDQRHQYHYPSPLQSPYKSPPGPPESYKVKSCKRCKRPFEPNWVVCPFCGESL